MAKNGRFQAVSEQLALQLAQGASVRAAAVACGCSERTVARRLKDPIFRHRLSEIRAASTERAINSLADGAIDAADTLRKLLTAESEQVRLTAAKLILDAVLKYREHDWNSRLDRREVFHIAQTLIEAVNRVVKDSDSKQQISFAFQSLLPTIA